MHIHIPVEPKSTHTHIYISNYNIDQQLVFGPLSDWEDTKLVVELTFHSNDFSPAKYVSFLERFQTFLDENHGPKR